MHNHIVLGGSVAKLNQTRYSPTGVPISRFVLDHRSQQSEAGFDRETRCRIAVMTAGEAVHKIVSQLAVGSQVKVSGFIARANNRQGVARLVLHAEQVEILT